MAEAREAVGVSAESENVTNKLQMKYGGAPLTVSHTKNANGYSAGQIFDAVGSSADSIKEWRLLHRGGGRRDLGYRAFAIAAEPPEAAVPFFLPRRGGEASFFAKEHKTGGNNLEDTKPRHNQRREKRKRRRTAAEDRIITHKYIYVYIYMREIEMFKNVFGEGYDKTLECMEARCDEKRVKKMQNDLTN